MGDFYLGVGDLADDGDVSVLVCFAGAEDDDIFWLGLGDAAVLELEEGAAGVEGAVWDGGVIEVSGVAPGVWHAVVEFLVVVAFDEFYALVF